MIEQRIVLHVRTLVQTQKPRFLSSCVLPFFGSCQNENGDSYVDVSGYVHAQHLLRYHLHVHAHVHFPTCHLDLLIYPVVSSKFTIQESRSVARTVVSEPFLFLTSELV